MKYINFVTVRKEDGNTQTFTHEREADSLQEADLQGYDILTKEYDWHTVVGFTTALNTEVEILAALERIAYYSKNEEAYNRYEREHL